MDRQEKLYYKNKVSDIITSYERQKQEEERQKILMKKQIMLSIMNNRQKANTQPPNERSESSKQEKTFKTSLSEDPIFENNDKQNHSLVRPNIAQPQSNPDSRFESEIGKESGRLDEITFNARKRNKSLQEELNFKESYLNQLRERRQKEEQEQRYKEEDVDNASEEYGEKYPPVQKSMYRSSHSEEEQRQEEKSYHPSTFNKYSDVKESFPSRKIQLEKSNRYEQPQEEYHSEHERDKEEEQVKAQPKGVFLTMEESESMVAQDQPKNIAFQIKMDKSQDPDNFEELKRNKIKEIERKRQQRIEQFRRNESQKKVEMPKGKNSYSKKTQKQQANESQVPPRSATIQRKANPITPAIPRKSEKQPINKNLIPLQSHQSQYNVRPASSKPIPSNYSHHQPERPPSYKQIHGLNEQREPKPVSPFKTPKTIYSQNNRGKSNGKGTNIFTIQNEGRQKSSNKYGDPKIQPKDRKNSFTRQSNKKLMINAITHVIFPGELNRKQRQRLIDIIDSSQYEFFIFLFKQYSRKMIKGIYTFDSSQVYLRKVYGDKSPLEITADMVQEFYRFDSGSREFKKVDGCRSFSLSIHAIDLRK